MQQTTAGDTRLAQVERLRAVYPTLPTEAILKEDILTEGVSFPAGMAPPPALALEGGSLELRRIILRPRPTPGARYAIEALGDGYALVDAVSEEPIASCRPYPHRPGYTERVLPGGRPCATVLDPLGVARLPLNDPRDPGEIAEAAAETFVLQTWDSGESPLAIRLSPDPAVFALSEGEQDAFLLPYLQALRARIGNIRPIFVELPPRDRAGEERLFAAGATGRTVPIEVWDGELFGRVGPRVGLDRDEWIARILELPFIYLDIHTQPVLLVGKELVQPGGFVDRATARRSTEEGIRFLLDHRVLVRLVHWAPPTGAKVDVEYHLDIDQAWYELWRETHREEPAGELLGPGHARDPLSAHLDVGRGAALPSRTASTGGSQHVR